MTLKERGNIVKDSPFSSSLLLTIDEAARFLGLSRRRTYQLAAKPGGTLGALPDGLVIRLGRSVRFSRPRLLAWIGAQGTGDE